MNQKTRIRITPSNEAPEKSGPYIKNHIHQKGESQKSFFKKILLCFFSVVQLMRVLSAFLRMNGKNSALTTDTEPHLEASQQCNVLDIVTDSVGRPLTRRDRRIVLKKVRIARKSQPDLFRFND